MLKHESASRLLCTSCAPKWLKLLLPQPVEWVGADIKCIGCLLPPRLTQAGKPGRVWLLQMERGRIGNKCPNATRLITFIGSTELREL